MKSSLRDNSQQTDLGVQNVHVISGEDIVGHVWFDPEDEMYFIDRPITIHLGQNQDNGRFTVAPLPLRPYLKKVERLPIENAHVMWILPVSEQMADLWQKATSDIIIPSGQDASNLKF